MTWCTRRSKCGPHVCRQRLHITYHVHALDCRMLHTRTSSHQDIYGHHFDKQYAKYNAWIGAHALGTCPCTWHQRPTTRKKNVHTPAQKVPSVYVHGTKAHSYLFAKVFSRTETSFHAKKLCLKFCKNLCAKILESASIHFHTRRPSRQRQAHLLFKKLALRKQEML
jgi:hypothetical protein